MCLWWWAHDRLLPGSQAARGLQPIRLVTYGLAATFTASYVAAFARPIDSVESLAADRSLLYFFGILGVVLLACDGILDRNRLEVFLRRLVAAATGVAFIGILQFVGLDVSGAFQFPFLTEHSDFPGVQIRSNLRRVAATSSHPIEFGVVLGLVLPLALHYALHAKHYKRSAWIPVVLIAIGIPLSVSRSGTLAAMVCFVGMWLTWDRPLRVRSAAYASALIVAMRFAVPGLIGTIKSLFINIGSDDSTRGADVRTTPWSGGSSARAPSSGAGSGPCCPSGTSCSTTSTWVPSSRPVSWGPSRSCSSSPCRSRLVEVPRRGGDPETRSLGQALAVSALGAAVAAGTFDFFAFMQATGVLVIISGCAGALWRLQTPEREAASAASARVRARAAGVSR